MRSHGETTLRKDQEDEKMKGKGWSRQRLEHVDGDVPLCMRNEDKDEDSKLMKIEKAMSEGGGKWRTNVHAKQRRRKRMNIKREPKAP